MKLLLSLNRELIFSIHCLFLVLSAAKTGLGLKCYVCSRRENPSFTIDASPSFRIVDNLPRDYCRRLDVVQCDRDHDVCFTVLQYKMDGTGRPPRSYSVSKGCYSSASLGFHDNGPKKKRCRQEKVRVKEEIRTGAPVKARRVNVFEETKRVCVCDANRCNGAGGRLLFGAVTLRRYLNMCRICGCAFCVLMTSAMVLLRNS